jgi:hypothetical protein
VAAAILAAAHWSRAQSRQPEKTQRESLWRAGGRAGMMR